ncbi:MAG: POTRA domain-containing protein, partial [Opitutaceae bacterium]
MRRVAFYLFAIVWGLTIGVAPVRAQEVPPQARQSDMPAFKVGTITIKFVGTANVNEQVVRANMQVREGGELDQSMLDRDIKSLYRTGLFEFINV